MLDKQLLYSVWFLSGISLLSLILSRELSSLVVLSIVLIVPFLFYLEMVGRLKKILWLENFLVLFFFIFSLIRFFYFNANFLIVVAEFLISFLIVKMGFAKERKDLMQIIILSLFVLLSAATLATDFSFFFSFLLFTIALCMALTLYTLSGGHSSELEPTLKGRLLLQYLFRNAGITLTLTILFSISIFIFFPRLSLAVFQGAFLSPAHKSGFSDSVNLSGTGKIFEDASVAMRVEILPGTLTPTLSPQGRGRISPLYLKGQTLTSFDGMRWTSGEKKSSWLVADPFRTRVLKAQKIVKNRFPILGEETKSYLKKKFSLELGAKSYLTQKIYLESLEGTHLFAVPWVEEIFAKVSQLSVAEDYTIQRAANFSGRAVYEVRSIVERPSEGTLIASPEKRFAEIPPDLQNYLQIPSMDFNRTKELLEKMFSKKEPHARKAKKLEKFFKEGEGFKYSLENPVKKSSNPVEEFLFETKTGHCEYFASAMALLLRLSGIPSRVVTGFLAQEWNPFRMGDGGYFVVRGKDAHAWVEAYVGDGLWLEFDPSPRISGADLEKEGLLALFKRRIDYLNFLWNAYVLSYDMESQKMLARNVEVKSAQFSRELDSFFAKGKRWFQKQRGEQAGKRETGNGRWNPFRMGNRLPSTFYLLPIFLLPLSVLLGIKLNYYFKNKRGGEPAVSFYSKMLSLFARKGMKKLRHETPYEFAKRSLGNLSQSKREELSREIETLTLLFCKIRYSAYIPTEGELASARTALQYLKNSL